MAWRSTRRYSARMRPKVLISTQAQLVTCRPSPARAAALASVIRSIERVSVEALDAQAKAVGLAGSMPRAFVSPRDPAGGVRLGGGVPRRGHVRPGVRCRFVR